MIHTHHVYADNGYLWSRAKYTMDEIHFGLTVTLAKFIKFKFIRTHYVAKTITQQIEREKKFAFVVATSIWSQKRVEVFAGLQRVCGALLLLLLLYTNQMYVINLCESVRWKPLNLWCRTFRIWHDCSGCMREQICWIFAHQVWCLCFAHLIESLKMIFKSKTIDVQPLVRFCWAYWMVDLRLKINSPYIFYFSYSSKAFTERK